MKHIHYVTFLCNHQDPVELVILIIIIVLSDHFHSASYKGTLTLYNIDIKQLNLVSTTLEKSLQLI